MSASTDNNEVPTNNTTSQSRKGKKRKRVKQSDKDEQYQKERTDRYNKLHHACTKHFHREAKVVKSFECQKIVRSIKALKDTLSNGDKDGEAATATSKAQKRLETLQQKLDRTKKMELDVLVQVGLKRLGVLSLDPKLVANDTNDTNDTNNKHLLEELIKKCKLYSLKAIENFDKNKSIKILDFIMKYSEIIGLDQDAIDSIKEIIKNKFQFDELVILNPSIDNLLDSDVYKLEYDNDIYYIPLWHQEITYDLSGKSLIVKCEPALEEHMYIDEKNTLHVNIKTSIIKLLDEQELDINIGKKVFKINISKLKLMRKQTYIIYKKGIKNIDINNIYNDNDKGNIIVHITICDKVCY